VAGSGEGAIKRIRFASLQAITLVVWIGWFFPTIGFAETPKAPDAKPAGIQKPFLWRIKAHADDKPSYLFGTIHLSRPSVTALPPRVLTALHAADAVYTEIPMDPATLVQMTPRMFLPDGKTLDDILPPDLLAEAKSALREIDPNLPFNSFSRMQIWAFAAGLAGLEDQIAYPGAIPQDMIVFQRGALNGKETGGLETPEEQLAIFEDLTADEQITMLRDGLRQMREIRKAGNSPSEMIVNLYLAGDLDALGVELQKWMDPSSSPLSAKLEERLLLRRNRLMAERISGILRTNVGRSAFFAVGAAHLYGETGLIALLQKRGFEVVRVGVE
jgi:uncharacterized protein YbaP (TraB family)